jgi:hypothetical protein
MVAKFKGTLPPKKKTGQAQGRRLHTGTMKDVAGLAAEWGVSEGEIRARVSRGQLPYKKWGGRIVFLAEELAAYLKALPGVSVEDAVKNTAASQPEEPR